jgi:glutaconate CoA-transferase subunit B
MSADYTSAEMMIAATGREIKDGEVIFAGVGIPCLGAQVALLTRAPNANIVMECGVFGSRARRIILGIGDNACGEGAKIQGALWRTFSDMQAGHFDVGMLGGAQIDKYGNLNSTTIFETGDYLKPLARLPGSGGANDIASSARRTILMVRLEKRRFVQRVDFITSPGHLEGGTSRKKAGLVGGGPSAVITNKAIFRFDDTTGEMYLESAHPGVTIEEVKESVSWDLKTAEKVKVTPPPTPEELMVIRLLDPLGIYLGNGLDNISFEAYIKMLEDSHGQLDKLYKGI